MGVKLFDNTGCRCDHPGPVPFALSRINDECLAVEDHASFGTNLFRAISGVWLKQFNDQPPANVERDSSCCYSKLRLRVWCVAGFHYPSAALFSDQPIRMAMVRRLFAGNDHAWIFDHTYFA